MTMFDFGIVAVIVGLNLVQLRDSGRLYMSTSRGLVDMGDAPPLWRDL